MKTLNTRWRLIALVPLVAITFLSIGNRIGAVTDQNREVLEAANEVGIVVEGGITQGQLLEFHVTRLANAHSGDWNLELTVFDAQGNVLVTHVFPTQNRTGSGLVSTPFLYDPLENPPPRNPDRPWLYDNNGRLWVIGIVRAIPGPNGEPVPHVAHCGFVVSGEIFNIRTGQTSVHIAGAPISSCR